MASTWIAAAFTLLLAALYVWLNDKKLNRIPSKVTSLSPNRWSPKDIRKTLEKYVNGRTRLLSQKGDLPPKTGRRYIIVGGVSLLIS